MVLVASLEISLIPLIMSEAFLIKVVKIFKLSREIKNKKFPKKINPIDYDHAQIMK